MNKKCYRYDLKMKNRYYALLGKSEKSLKTINSIYGRIKYILKFNI